MRLQTHERVDSAGREKNDLMEYRAGLGGGQMEMEVTI